MRFVLVGFVAAMVLGGGTGNAEIVMSEPTNLGPVINDARDAQECDFSHDGLELYFAPYNRPGGFGGGDIYMAERKTLNSPLQEPVNLGPNVNSSGSEVEPSISGDGLELYFGCWDDYILRVCTRPSKDAPWSTPVKIGPPVGSDEPAMEIGSNDAWSPEISADGLSLYFTSTRVGGYSGDGDIWVSKRATKDDPWGEPVNLGPNVNSGAMDWSPSISTNGLTLIFSRQSPGSLWATTRRSTDDDWGPSVQLPLHSPGGWLHGPTLSPDGSTLYLEAYAAWGGYGAGDFWQVNFIPIVDFNNDGVIKCTDMWILIDNLYTDNLLCDIAPLPVGDGIVDEKDLLALSKYMCGYCRPVAHWTFDETEGMFAVDSAGNNDALVVGGASWQPGSGQVDGALQLDGVSGCAIAGTSLNPADGPFSIFAWVKGGASGHVVVSQMGVANWLCIDSSEGILMTELAGHGSDSGPLQSQTVITDGAWHRIGFVWDGSHRMLYVDDIKVAEDAQDVLDGSTNSLYIGTGKMMQLGTYFSGMIDDIRIYDRALTQEQIAALSQ